MHRRRQRGFSLIEVAIVVVLIGILAAAGAPLLRGFMADMRVKQAARGVADSFGLARSEAIRTGNNHLVLFNVLGGTDAGGNPILDVNGNFVPVMVVNDTNTNCEFPGDPAQNLPAIQDVNWGITNATAAAPLDFSGGAFASGITFADPAGNPVNWVLFRSDGVPVGFSNTCGVGQTGSGGGAVYLTNGDRDYAITLTALGQARVHVWDTTTGQWSN